MRVADLEALPPDSRVWVFGVDRELTHDEETAVLDAVDGFLREWTAHGTPLTGARSWRYGRFLIVGVDEASAPPSGCSIDALVRVLKSVESEIGARFLGNEAVWFRMGDGIQRLSRAEFRALALGGRVTPNVVVFNNSITRLHELDQNGWEGPARDHWHGEAFFPEG